MFVAVYARYKLHLRTKTMTLHNNLLGLHEDQIVMRVHYCGTQWLYAYIDNRVFNVVQHCV